MKKFLMAVAALACMSTLALAGPNAGGTIVAHDASLLASQTDGSVSLCGQGLVPPDCASVDGEIDGVTIADPALFKVYAAFPTGSAPRLMGITWGIVYDPEIVIVGGQMCGNFELNDPTWPASGTGSSVTWPSPQMGLLTPVYSFLAYTYGNPQLFHLGPNPSPTLGGYFGDDAIPAHLDPITAFGTLGFDEPGDVTCPPEIADGACCDPATGDCTITLPADCGPPFVFHPEFTTCQPNPCPPPLRGACCIGPDCQILTQLECETALGTYIGDGTLCDPNPCAATGACCASDQTCTITTQADCVGTYMGDNTVCDPNPCVVPTEKTSWGTIKNQYR